MKPDKENIVSAKEVLTVKENTGCCLKCKGKENNTCSKLLLNEELQETENNQYADLKNWQPDALT